MDTKDRELLDLAAKAADIRLEWVGASPVEIFSRWSGDPDDYPETDCGEWNPLTDDGQAMKLAVKLDISLRLDGDELTGIASWYRKGKLFRVVGNYHTGRTKDARRLIVLAAAEIGRAAQ